MARATKTVNPIHFEDLEPHRFEDLVRQLIYDFRKWSLLEAVGRSGSDDGIDIRGIEASSVIEKVSEGENEEDELDESLEPESRLWIIQCKRHQKIGPKDITEILEDFFSKNTQTPFGYILIAPCEFSLKSRKQFAIEVSKRGITEGYVFGKGELEDILFRPQNDHLLFAYFGISLQVRKRGIQAKVRSELTLKRALVRHVAPIEENQGDTWIFIRDPSNLEYPRPKDEKAFQKNPSWKFWRFISHQAPNKIAFVKKMCFAYLSEDEEKWDAFLDFDLEPGQNHMRQHFERAEDDQNLHSKLHSIWHDEISESCRAWYFEVGIIPYDRILAVDSIGDANNKGVHLLVSYTKSGSPFEETTYQLLSRNRVLDDFVRVREITRIDVLSKVREKYEIEEAKPIKVRKTELISRMELLKQELLAEAIDFYSQSIFNLSGNIVSAPGNSAIANTKGKLAELKKDIRDLQNTSKEVITKALSGSAIWWHENIDVTPEDLYSSKIPKAVEEPFRYAIGKVAPILRKHGFIGQNDFWRKPTERGYYSQPVQEEYSNHNFDFTEKFKLKWKEYSKAFQKFNSLTRFDPFSQRDSDYQKMMKRWKEE